MAGRNGRTLLAFPGGTAVDLVLIRFFFVLFVTVTCYRVDPFGVSPRYNAIIGAALGAAIVLFEWRLRRMSLRRLIGAAFRIRRAVVLSAARNAEKRRAAGGGQKCASRMHVHVVLVANVGCI